MYRNNPCFVPPLYGEEKKIFRRNSDYSDTCVSEFFLAVRDGKTVGRIQAICQMAANEKNGTRRIRFTRFDSIDDTEVAKALFDAVEAWARARGMDTVCGPLGYSDLEREGLLIEGFDQLSTFEEQYNAPYYARLIEACGYRKEVDWFERKIYLPDNFDPEKSKKLSDYILNRYRLHYANFTDKNEVIRKYADDFIAAVDDSYAALYGTVPFTENMKKSLLKNFDTIIDVRFVRILLDENDRVAAFGVAFPSVGAALAHTDGRLTPRTLLRLLKALRKPRVIDFGLVGVSRDYRHLGIGALALNDIYEMMHGAGIEYAETNLCLEDNLPIHELWKHFRTEHHKTRRSYCKTL